MQGYIAAKYRFTVLHCAGEFALFASHKLKGCFIGSHAMRFARVCILQLDFTRHYFLHEIQSVNRGLLTQ